MRLFNHLAMGVLMDPVTAVSAGVGGIGSIVGGLLGSKASKNAANAQAGAQQDVVDNTNKTLTQGYYDVNTGTDRANSTLQQSNAALQQNLPNQVAPYQPFSNAGAGALSGIQDFASDSGPLSQQFQFGQQNLDNDPGYQFTLQQGQQAIQKAAAAQGNLFSTGTLKSLAGYTTGAANQYFGDAYNRAANTFNINRQGALSRLGALQGLSQMGLSAASGISGAVGNNAQLVNANQQQVAGNQLGSQQFLANLGMQGNQTIAAAKTNQGNANAAGTIGSANAWSGALSGIGNAAQNASILNFLSKRQ